MARLFVTNKKRKIPDTKRYGVIVARPCTPQHNPQIVHRYLKIVILGYDQISEGNTVFVDMGQDDVKEMTLLKNSSFSIATLAHEKRHETSGWYYVTNNKGVITEIYKCTK